MRKNIIDSFLLFIFLLSVGFHVCPGAGLWPGPAALGAGDPRAGQVPRHQLLHEEGLERQHPGELPLPHGGLLVPGEHGGLHQENLSLIHI